MLLVNYISASFCNKHSIPAIYIGQEPPDESIPYEIITDRATLQEVVRFMKKSYFSTIVRRHFALGLSTYTQATSPIRRFLDLLIQKQIKEFILSEKFFYSEEEVQNFRGNIEHLKGILGTIEDETNKYWLLKYLLQNFKNKFVEALVLKELPDGYLVEIFETNTMAKVKTQKILDIGQNVKFKLHTIFPRLGITMGNI